MSDFLLNIPYPEWLPSPEFVITSVTVITIVSTLMIPVALIVASYFVYVATLRRTNANKWKDVSADIEPDQLKMYAVGDEWHRKHISAKKDVHILNDGLNLYGEYYDFGGSTAVIIMSGRTESHIYGYYFAIPYSELGINVLVIDPRAHGKSDGEFNTTGFEESRDAIAWAEFLHTEFNVEKIILHGICIGAAGAMYALTSESCPEYIKGMVAEGMFADFGDSMKNHLIERKKPVFIVYTMINFWMKHYTGHNMDFGPRDVIGKLDKPILMLHSREDIYSTPENAQMLYDRCPSEQKSIVWYEHGAHSMLRYVDSEMYDGAIKNFVSESFDIDTANDSVCSKTH